MQGPFGPRTPASAILPRMAPFSRRLRRIDAPRLAAAALGVAMVIPVAAYLYALTVSTATAEGVASAVAAVAIVAAGLLYAVRAVSGGLDE
jgi:hypothetical protein